MIKREIIKQQVQSKVAQLSTWQKVRYQGGRLYYEKTIIINEISDYPTEIQIYYLETLLKQKFIIQDNLPSEAPDITPAFKDWIRTTISRLKINTLTERNDFTERDIEDISLDKINIDSNLKQILILRIEEIKKALKSNSNLSVLFMTGSVMEGLLLGFAMQYPKIYNASPSAPKDESNKVKHFKNWTLSDFINVSFQLVLLNEDVKKHSHSLREFRNYIHPNEQLKSLFIPDNGTSKINWHVLKACVNQLSDNEKKLKNK